MLFDKTMVVIVSKVIFGMKREDNFNKEATASAKTRLMQSVNYQLTVFGTNKEVIISARKLFHQLTPDWSNKISLLRRGPMIVSCRLRHRLWVHAEKCGRGKKGGNRIDTDSLILYGHNNLCGGESNKIVIYWETGDTGLWGRGSLHCHPCSSN